MKHTKHARVIYNKAEDRFDVELQYEDGSWGLDAAFKCVALVPGATDFIHYDILGKIKQYIMLGYEIDFLGEHMKGVSE